MELSCWDGWGLADREAGDDVLAKDAALLDRVAALTLAGTSALLETRTPCENETSLHVPGVVRSYTRAGVRLVTLAG